MPQQFQPYDLVRLADGQRNERAVVVELIDHEYSMVQTETSGRVAADNDTLSFLLPNQRVYLDNLKEPPVDLKPEPEPEITPEPEPLAAAGEEEPNLARELGPPDWSLVTPSDGRPWLATLELWSTGSALRLVVVGPGGDLERALEELLASATAAQRAVFIQIQERATCRTYRPTPDVLCRIWR